MTPIGELSGHFEEIWNNTPADFPLFGKTYLRGEQKSRERIAEQFRDKAKKLQDPSVVHKIRNNPGPVIFPYLKSLLLNVFDFEQHQLDIILSDSFKHVSKDFFYDARKFGPELKPEDIYQAMRNVWIINGLQMMMGKPVEITPSVFAYSMIYPYSDNFIDSPEITDDEKVSFSHRFKLRLQGNPVIPATQVESQLYRLFTMIEGQYPRHFFDDVYQSIYAIHDAQTSSLGLTPGKHPDRHKILSVSFEKGGASVLADGYLAAGNLTASEEFALFGYGIYLQLLDDINDLEKDLESQVVTLYTVGNAAERSELVSKTIGFGREAMKKMAVFSGQNTTELIRLMNYSIETMIVQSVGLTPQFYTKEFLQQMEQHSPLSFEYLREKRREAGSQRVAMFTKYLKEKVFSEEEMALSYES